MIREENGENKEKFNTLSDYLNSFKEKAKESKVYSKHQFMGLALADILGDEKHKALYIKLAKLGDPDRLIALAKNIAENKNIKNKGAYFMALWKKTKDEDIGNR